MRVQIVDPSAFTPPYDHALAAALARAGIEVELVTSRFLYGPVPREAGYDVTELFYRRTGRRGLGARGRRALKLAEHVPDMIRLGVHKRDADLVHYQWITVPWLDAALVPPARRPAAGRRGFGLGASRQPRVFTVHYPLPRGRWALRRERALLGRMDAVIAHSRYGARRLREEVGLDTDRVHVVAHGAFDYLTRLPEERPLPPDLAAVEGPVVLFFGLLRPYKGIDVLLEAFRDLEGAELWIVGMPRMELDPLLRAAARARSPVRFVPRFITDPEIPAFFRRADLVVLPYRDADQSGVLYTALAFGKPLVASAVGGFAEVAEDHGALRLVPPGDPGALATALAELVGDPSARELLAERARGAASGPYSWDSVADRTLALYRRLLASR